MMTTISKKVCLLGDFAVGKTSLVRRFVYDLFNDKYISTIGVKVSRKTVVVPRTHDLVELAMMLWDLGGSEEFVHPGNPVWVDSFEIDRYEVTNQQFADFLNEALREYVGSRERDLEKTVRKVIREELRALKKA